MRRALMTTVLMISAAGMWTTGCTKPEIQESQTEVITIERDYLKLLSEMTRIMQEDRPEAAQNLDDLRQFIEKSGAGAKKTVNEFNRQVLQMDEETRASWRKSARPSVEKGLEAYAQAQIHLQKRLTDAQKWELSEILSLLKQ